MNPYYICIEGVEGMGKTTQVSLLCDFLSKKFPERVVQTAEPGSKLSPISMEFRNMMLNNEWGSKLSTIGREYCSQAARSQVYHDVVIPSLKNNKIIVSDRGLLSGLSYGVACGNDREDLLALQKITTKPVIELNNTLRRKYELYDLVILLVGDAKKGLERARTSKKEFAKGDFIEEKGISFMKQVQELMIKDKDLFSCPVHVIHTTTASIEDIHTSIVEIVNSYVI